MGRIYSDTEKLLKASKLQCNGHHTKAANIYQNMGNEFRKPSEKKQNQKDFLKYQNPNVIGLERYNQLKTYFYNWLQYLESL